MKYLVLHISDIHMKSNGDFMCERATRIGAALYEKLPIVDEIIIVVSGDIAYSGLHEEYINADKFLSRICETIKNEKNIPINYVMVPGNHDCDFEKNTSVRDTIVKDIIEKGEVAIDDCKILECIKPQENYINFSKKFVKSNTIYEDELLRCQEFGNDYKLRFYSFNVSWMSQKNEKQGHLVFPISKYKSIGQTGDSLKFIVLHHPLNWYVQGTYHPFKNYVKTVGDFVISGHEHLQGAHEADDALCRSCIYVDGGVINPHEAKSVSSFNVLYVDTLDKKYSCQLYSWDGNIYVPRVTEKSWSEPRNLPEKLEHAFPISREFEAAIINPGANFSHPAKDTLSLPDIFVHPDLGHLDSGRKIKKYSNAKLLNDLSVIEKGVVIRGQNKAGKTSLLYTLYSKYHEQHKIPLYINCSTIVKTSDAELGASTDKAVVHQYGEYFTNHYRQSSITEKIVLLDDYDRMMLSEKNRMKVLEYYIKRCKYLVITTSDMFDVRELLSPGTAEAVKSFVNYDLMSFGHVLRLNLIQKWYNIGDFNNNSDIEQNYKIDQAEKILNTVLGKNLIPSVPIYLLALLQSIESGQKNQLENSAFGHYYNYLISDAMKEIAVRPEEWDEFYSYCSLLAWEYRNSRKKELDINDIRNFTTKFGEEYHYVEFAVRIKQLCDAKLLYERNGYYSFTYPYIYYFFLGKYLANHLNEPEIRSHVEYLCDHLYVSDYGNTILFLTHFSKDAQVITRILGLLSRLFADKTPVKFEEDTVKYNELLDNTTEMIVDDTDIYDNRRQANIIKDNIDRNQGQDQEVEIVQIVSIHELDLFTKINLLFKTTDIIGQILKSYYGSIPNKQKENMITEVFDAPLRALKDFVDYIYEEKEGLVKEVEGWIEKEGKKLDNIELKAKARQGVFNVVGMLNFLFLYKTSNAVASEKLSERIHNIVKANPTIAYKLIELGTKLELPGKMPIEDISQIKHATEGNIFARRILETFVVHHMYMFKTGIRDKQRIKEVLGIEVGVQHNIDIKSSHMKRIS